MSKVIKSTGPIPCDYMVVAERPGREEASRGYVLCGPSGQELDRFLLNNSGLCRDSVRCTNLVRDYRDGENPEEWEVVRDWPLMVQEVLDCRPQYILALGLWSSRAFLGHDLDLEWANGLAFPLNRSSWPGIENVSPRTGCFTVMPCIHTAATLHQPKYAAQCMWAFEQFGKLVRGEEMPTGHLRDIVPEPKYWEANPTTMFSGSWAVDTEGTVTHPWCSSWATKPGEAMVQFRGHCYLYSDESPWAPGMVTLHNAIHDLPVLASMGIVPQRFTDTMLMANLLCVEPLGLKPLARRLCGMRMREYDEVVAPARRERALEYLGKVLEHYSAKAHS